MAVVEDELHGVLADRFNRPDAHVLFSEHQHLLPGAVALDLGGGGMHAQVLERQLEVAAVVESDVQDPRLGPQPDLGGGRLGHPAVSLGRTLRGVSAK